MSHLTKLIFSIAALVTGVAIAAEPTPTSPESDTPQSIESATPEPSPISTEQSGVPWTPRDEDIRILGIKVGHYNLEEIIAAYQFEDVVLIPLGQLSESIGIAIDSRPESGLAEGFVITSDRTFFLDTDNEQVILKGKIKKYDPSQVHVLIDDIYIDANLLTEWLGFDIAVNLFLSQVWVKSEVPLPFERKLEREKKIARTLSRIRSRENNYPRHYEPYRSWTMPFINHNLRTDFRKLENGDTELNYDHTTHVTADLAKLESTWYANGDDDSFLDDFRVTFGRKDPESDLLGPLKATEFAFGHIFEPRINLITQPSTLNPGVLVTNFEMGRQIEYDRHTFIGELLPGWEVELYRNNSLLGYLAEPIEGQYRFRDIPLLYGSNHFRLVFYGPQGQTREESQRFELGDSLTKPGQQFYRASLSDSDEGQRLIAEYDLGINKNISASVNLSNIPVEIAGTFENHNFLQAGIRSYFEKYFMNFDVVKDMDGGTAFEFGLQTRFADTIFGFNQTALSDFVSEEFRSTGNNIESRTTINIDTQISTSFIPSLPIGFEIINEQFENGATSNRISNDISFSVHNVSYYNLLTHQSSTNVEDQLFGTLQLSQYTGEYGLRGTINYTLSPLAEMTNLTMNYDLRNFHEYLLNLTLTHSVNSSITEIGASLNKPIDEYNLNFGARVNTEGEYVLEANFSIGIGQEPRSGDWITTSRTIAGNGNLSARVFIDGDQDGILDDDDLPLSDVGFIINGSARRELTNESGIMFMNALPAHSPMDISVAKGTLEDPLWNSAIEGVRIIPRPGTTIELDFPVFLTGEIDGTVYLEENKRKSGVGGVTVQVFNQEGQVIRSVETAYDGFYIISDIPIGNYRVTIADKHLENLRFRGRPYEPIDITIDSRYLNGIDFTLRR